MICRHCKNPFDQEAFEVFCSPDCTDAFNSGNREVSVRDAGFSVAVVRESNGWSEEEFRIEFERRAAELGWKTYHTKDSRKSKAGYPDETCWRDRVIFAELKDEDGKASAAQLTTIEELVAAGAEVYLWRPSDWPEIEEILK